MKQKFSITGMSCTNCVKHMSEVVRAQYPNAAVTLKPPQLTLNTKETVSLDRINDLLSGTKYRIKEINLFSAFATSIKQFLPLIVMVLIVVLFAIVHTIYLNLHFHEVLQYFMAGYFLLFGGLKVVNWKKFVPSYRVYDPLAQRSQIYAWAYPAIEFGIGIMLYFGITLLYVNTFVVFLMIQKAFGVYAKLKSGEIVQCACLGGFFSIPITKVPLCEDTLMALMALYMLLLI